MKRTTILTVMVIVGAALFAVGMLASFAGPVAAQNEADNDEGDTTVCTIEAPDTATDSAETSLCQLESPDDGVTILTANVDGYRDGYR